MIYKGEYRYKASNGKMFLCNKIIMPTHDTIHMFEDSDSGYTGVVIIRFHNNLKVEYIVRNRIIANSGILSYERLTCGFESMIPEYLEDSKDENMLSRQRWMFGIKCPVVDIFTY